jgi:hypothetical protein
MVTNGLRNDTLRGDVIAARSAASAIALVTMERLGWLAANWSVGRSQFAILELSAARRPRPASLITVLVSFHRRSLGLVVLQHKSPLFAGGRWCEPGEGGGASRH